MDFGVSELVDELKTLRKGYGVQAPDITARVGSALRVACGITDEDSPTMLRYKVVTTLTELTGALPDDLRLLGRTALGLDGTAGVRYEERVRQLAGRLGRDPRTVQRRIDQVLQRVAEQVLDGSPRRIPVRHDPPWHTVRLEVLVVLDLPIVEVVETRRIVSHRSGLIEVDHSVTVAPPPDWDGAADAASLGIDVFRGGVLHAPRLRSPNRLGFQLRLLHPLDSGEEHEFALRMKVACAFAPYYVCTPQYPCERFELTVRFGPGRAPERIWLLDNEFPLELNDPWPERTPVRPDSAGEVRFEFTDLEPHRSYGLGWEPLPA